MMNKFELMIKNLIWANIIITDQESETNLYELKYFNMEFDITLHKRTDYDVVINYFYEKIKEFEGINDEE